MDECVCFRCTYHAGEHELQLLFECPAYQQIRIKYGSKFFSRFWVDMYSAIKTGKVPAFMNQSPKLIACFAVECLHRRQ